jgi:hypothetical protein
MPIKVLVDMVSSDDIQQILDYYNQNKTLENEPLQRLDRFEGGFQICLPEMKDVMCDSNKKIKQLRWHKGYLVSSYYIGFNDNEQDLLYRSLVHVLGEENIILEGSL